MQNVRTFEEKTCAKRKDIRIKKNVQNVRTFKEKKCETRKEIQRKKVCKSKDIRNNKMVQNVKTFEEKTSKKKNVQNVRCKTNGAKRKDIRRKEWCKT